MLYLVSIWDDESTRFEQPVRAKSPQAALEYAVEAVGDSLSGFSWEYSIVTFLDTGEDGVIWGMFSHEESIYGALDFSDLEVM